MTEFSSGYEPESIPTPLDRELIVGRLQEFGIGIEPEDLEGEDDEAVMGIILTYATMYDFDIDDILPQVTPVEKRKHEEDGEL